MASPKSLGALGGILEELNFIVASIRLRGVKHYARALALGAAFIFVAQKFVFVSGREALTQVKNDLEAARATAQYADTYKELDNNIKLFAQRLPSVQEPQTWFLNTVLDSLRAEGLVALSLSPVTSTDAPNFKYLAMSLTFKSKFSQTANWVARIEGSKKLLHISDISVRKDPEKIGSVDVQVVVASLVPKGGL